MKSMDRSAPDRIAVPPGFHLWKLPTASQRFTSFRRGSERVDVLNGVTLGVPEGQFLGLMGPSGSGKTTLLNLIAGLDTPSQGEIWVGDQLISGMSEGQLAGWRTRHIGFVFQFYHLLPVLSAFENVELPLLLLPSRAGEGSKSPPRWNWWAWPTACATGRASSPAASSNA